MLLQASCSSTRVYLRSSFKYSICWVLALTRLTVLETETSWRVLISLGSGFLRKPELREINALQDISISKTLNLIEAKTQHLKYLKEDLRYMQVEEQLACKNIQAEIRKFEEKFKQEVCSDLPTAFWHRKKHEVALPYVKDFHEKDIPTKA